VSRRRPLPARRRLLFFFPFSCHLAALFLVREQFLQEFGGALTRPRFAVRRRSFLDAAFVFSRLFFCRVAAFRIGSAVRIARFIRFDQFVYVLDIFPVVQ